MSIGSYFSVLAQRWRWVVGAFLITLLAVLTYTHVAPRQYTTSAQVFVSVNDGGSDADMYQGSLFATSQLASYRSLAVSPLILEPVIENLRLNQTADELAKDIVVTTPEESTLIIIQVTADNPQKSADIANATADELAAVTTDLAPKRSSKRGMVTSRVLMKAVPPEIASAPNLRTNLVFGVVGAIALGMAVAALRNVLDTRVSSTRRLERIGEVPVIGSLPSSASAWAGGTPVGDSKASPFFAHALERLKTNFLVRSTGSKRGVLVTATGSESNKRAVVLLLAAELARSGNTVCVVDADHTGGNTLRLPEFESGGRDSNDLPVSERAVPIAGVSMTAVSLTADRPGVPVSVSELGSAVDALVEVNDVVLVSAPALARSGEALLMAQRIKDVVLVTSAKDKLNSAEEAIEALTGIGATVSAVLFDAHRRDAAPLGGEPPASPAHATHRAPSAL